MATSKPMELPRKLAQMDAQTLRDLAATLISTRAANMTLQAVIYDFADSRSGINAREFLGAWKGKLVCDDYSGYNPGSPSSIISSAIPFNSAIFSSPTFI